MYAAVHNAPSLSVLQGWARDSSGGGWSDLLYALTDLFLDELDARTPGQTGSYSDIVEQILQKVSVEHRAHLSNTVAPVANFPPMVIKRLAYDDAVTVAAPVLEQSPVLTDTDLISILEKALPERGLSISKREILPRNVTHSLVSTGNVEIIRQVTANHGADFSEGTYRIIANKAKLDAQLLDHLVARPDVNSNVATLIMPFLTIEHKKILKIRANGIHIPQGVGDAFDIPANASSRSSDQNKSAGSEIDYTVDSIRSGDVSLDDVIMSYVSDDNLGGVRKVIATYAEIPEKAVSFALFGKNKTPLAVICRGIGIGASTYTNLSALRNRRLGNPLEQISVLNADYLAIKEPHAQKTLVMLRQKQKADL